jgi:hypothetical protein
MPKRKIREMLRLTAGGLSKRQIAASARILSRVIDQRGAPGSVWALRLFGRY